MYLKVKKMVEKINNGTRSKIILVLITVILSGCSQNNAPETAKTANVNQNVNQAATNLNNNNVAAAAPLNTPTTTTVNNTSVPTVNKDKKSSVSVKEPTPQIGSGGNDMFFLAQARSALSSDEELLNSVIVEIKEGNAVLTGSVSSEAQKTKAGQLIQTVKGLKSVKNNLRVSR